MKQTSGLSLSCRKTNVLGVLCALVQRVDALSSTGTGWLLSDENGLWRSSDGEAWTAVPNSKPALTLFRTEQGVWAGGEDGAMLLDI